MVTGALLVAAALSYRPREIKGAHGRASLVTAAPFWGGENHADPTEAASKDEELSKNIPLNNSAFVPGGSCFDYCTNEQVHSPARRPRPAWALGVGLPLVGVHSLLTSI